MSLFRLTPISITMLSSGQTAWWCWNVWLGSLGWGTSKSWALLTSTNVNPTSTESRTETCPPNNALAFDNAIQIVETGGLRIAIWGDNRAVPDPSLDHYLKNVDVLI